MSAVMPLCVSSSRVFVYDRNRQQSKHQRITFIGSHSVSCCVCFLSGWFCVSAAWNSQPFDLDNYTNANCLCPATSTGGRCQVGFYCPSGSQEPLPCPPGAFCNISGILSLLIKTRLPLIHSLNNTRLIFSGNKENY